MFRGALTARMAAASASRRTLHGASYLAPPCGRLSARCPAVVPADPFSPSLSPSFSASPPASSFHTGIVRSLFSFGSSPEPNDVEGEVQELHNDTLMPLNARLLGPLEKYADQLTPMPLVFVIGNHSSGKSTFINHILGRSIQKTGVAPTDDAFTVVVPGHVDADQNGPALVGDPDLGFTGLRHFGTALINHLNLKVRTGLAANDVMLVDSPGMIDSPINSGIGSVDGPKTANDFVGTMSTPRDRGYNFPGVVRWFAERADVILLFFDPDKPGTTGETLACMTQSLMGLDHKVHIILNKVDQFTHVHDFARAYGSLCWNLSKVIPRKDLPPIYTMCVPSPDGKKQEMNSSVRDALGDLESAREEIIHEVLNAPARRLDNLITRLYDSSRLLKMHAQVLEAVRKDYKSVQRRWLAASAAVGLVSASIGWGSVMLGLWEVGAVVGVTGIVSAGAVWFRGEKMLSEKASYYLDGDGLDAMFRKIFFVQLADSDDFVVALWERVRPELQKSIRTITLKNLPAVRPSDLSSLDDIIDSKVPQYRRLATKSGAFLTSDSYDKAAKAIEALAASEQTSR